MTQQAQAGAEAAQQGAPAGSDNEANPASQPATAEGSQPSRVQEFLASLTEPTEIAEFRKATRELNKPDFEAQDKVHQQKTAAQRKRADAAEQAVRDLGDEETAARYRDEQGSLEKAKTRAVKLGKLPEYVARRINTFDDLWEAEDDHAANAPNAGRSAGDATAPDDDDAAFAERLKRLGVPVNAGAAPNEPLAPNGGGVGSSPTYEALRAKYADGGTLTPTELHTLFPDRY